MGIFDFLFKNKTEDVTELRQKYESFRSLLNLNNEALERMAELEGMLFSDEPVTQEQIRAKWLEIHEQVSKMVQALNTLSDSKYIALKDCLAKLHSQMESEFVTVKGTPFSKLCLPLQEIGREHADVVGGKVATLGEVANRVGLPVPDGFGISAFAYRAFVEGTGLQDSLQKVWEETDFSDIASILEASKKMQSLVLKTPLPQEVQEAIRLETHDLYRRTKGKARVSVRSSATLEDSRTSFAGQYSTCLGARLGKVVEHYREVVASKFSPRALFYMHTHNYNEKDIAMAVGCFVMIDARCAGVAYSVDPLDEKMERMMVSATWGLGKPVVDGTTSPDVYYVDRKPGRNKVEAHVAYKTKMLVLGKEEGIEEVWCDESVRGARVLEDEKVLELASHLRALEAHFRFPVDCEWAMDKDGKIFILQARPLRLAPRKVASESAIVSGMKVLLKGGSCVVPGVASGVVFRARKDEDLARFPDGGVLVAHESSPWLVKVMTKANAMVTEVGSPFGHMSSLAREYRVVSLTNVGDTSVLKDGMEVTVDASNGVIYEGRIEGLVVHRGIITAHDYKALGLLERVLQRISRLNLLDPARSSFRAKNCQTYHDVVRFCHEMAICEMFSINDYDNIRNKGIAYKLDAPLPLRIYVIDIGEGLRRPKEGKTIKPDDILSVPMRALWEGMTTEGVTWAGARPIDLKGFVSVFANTMYDPAKWERGLGETSYAIVDKYYVNFGSRLGYHFTTIDAVCGDSQEENYILFRFKGGAADLERRTRRTRFVSDVLNYYKFSVDQKEDLLNAWTKRLSCEETKELLRVVGRLIGCARQLDVVMDTDATLEQSIDAFISGNYRFFEFKSSA